MHERNSYELFDFILIYMLHIFPIPIEILNRLFHYRIENMC
jgi:hypothetical protein